MLPVNTKFRWSWRIDLTFGMCKCGCVAKAIGKIFNIILVASQTKHSTNKIVVVFITIGTG